MPKLRLEHATDKMKGLYEEVDFLIEIASQALIVRTCQKEYFKTRGTAELQASKIAERELDRLLSETWPPVPTQESLL